MNTFYDKKNNFIIIAVVFLTVLLPVKTISGDMKRLTSTSYMFSLPQGITINGNSGYGYNLTTQATLTNVNQTNPANIYDFKNFNTGISYQFRSDIEEAYVLDFGYNYEMSPLPQSATFTYSLSDLVIGIGMNQSYNSILDYGEIRPTFIDTTSPTGYREGETINPYRKTMSYQYSTSFSYGFNSILLSEDNFILAARINYNYVSITNVFGLDFIDDIQNNVSQFSGSFGMRYSVLLANKSNIRIGTYYDMPIEYDKIVDDIKFIGYIPGIVHVGIQFRSQNGISLNGDLSYWFYEESENRFYPDYKNQLEFGGSVSYEIKNNLSLSLGFFNTDRKFLNENSYFVFNYSATYLIAGMVWNLKPITIDFSIADSHWLSDDWRRQTIIRGGIGYKL